MATWYSAATAEEQQRVKAAWADAPISNVELCNMILGTARTQVLKFAPPLPDEALLVEDGIVVPDEDAIPDHYVLAQLYQARNLWNASRSDGDGEVGPDGFAFRPAALAKNIKTMLRPIDGNLHVL